jgi:hypothetical protein
MHKKRLFTKLPTHTPDKPLKRMKFRLGAAPTRYMHIAPAYRAPARHRLSAADGTEGKVAPTLFTNFVEGEFWEGQGFSCLASHTRG